MVHEDIHGLARELAVFQPFDVASLDGIALSDLVPRAIGHLDQALIEQKARLGAPFPLVARYLILTSLDEAWRTHLYNLDDLKGGIGWTAFGGTDPLVAFKRESFVLFQEMLAQTAEKIVRILLNPRLTIAQEGAPDAKTAPTRSLRFERPDVSQTAPTHAPSNPGQGAR